MNPADDVVAHLDKAGFNACTVLEATAYDSCVSEAWRSGRIAPRTRSAIVVAHGGRAFWERFRASPEARGKSADPVDDYTRRSLEEAAALREPALPFALYSETRDGAFLPLLALSEASGLGRRGRIGLLIHREFGPWLGMRGVLFARDPGPRAGAPATSPCEGCAAPCIAGCPGGAVGTELDALRCADTRKRHEGCHFLCEARVACCVGREHRYEREQQLYHGRASAAALFSSRE